MPLGDSAKVGIQSDCFGDCFAYALAKCRAEPLLFKGNDFSNTDVLLP